MKRYLTGLVIGLAVSSLTAPGTGKTTRRQLINMANNQKKRVQTQWSRIRYQWERTLVQVERLVETAKASSGFKA